MRGVIERERESVCERESSRLRLKNLFVRVGEKVRERVERVGERWAREMI